MPSRYFLAFILSLVLTVLPSIETTHAVDHTAVQDGNWDAPATWGGTVPSPVDKATIPAGITVTIPTGVTVARNAFTEIDGSILNTNGGIFRIYGTAMLINDGNISN